MSEGEEPSVALKLLHTADWHLGMRFPSLPEDDQLTLMRARMAVIDRILGVAEHNQVDAVLCAGDLFDEPTPHEDWWRGLLTKFHAREGWERPVFLLPGNHDPLTHTSIYHPSHPFRHGLPQWVHVVDQDDFTASLGPDAVLYAVPCRSAAGKTGLHTMLPARAPEDDRIRVGMIHGQTMDLPGYQTNFPIPADAAAQRGLDYLAIGDTHAFREVVPQARYPVVYPSAPEPTKHGETDAGYVALVFIPKGRRRPIIRRERVGRWTWEERTCTSLDQLRALADGQDLRSTVLRLRLEMSVSADQYEAAQTLLRVLGGTHVAHGRVGVLQVDRSGLELDTTDLETAFEDLPDVLQRAAKSLRAHEGTELEPKAKRALYHLYRLVKGQGQI